MMFSQSQFQHWLVSLELHLYMMTYACTFLVICCLVYASIQSPVSRVRWLMLVPIIALTFTSAKSVLATDTWPPMRVAMAITLGVNLALECINHLCVRRAFIDLSKKHHDKYTAWYAFRHGADLVFNKRLIGTPHQVKGVPAFDSRNPGHVPSRTQFLTFRTARVVILLGIGILLIRDPTPEILRACHPGEGPVFPIRMLQGAVDIEEYTYRFILTISFLISAVLFQILGHDIISLVAVGIFNNNPAAWPPRFGSVATAYNIRGFWGTFWHQDLRAMLTCYSNMISDNILHLPKTGILQRYAKIYLCFGISGVVHIYGEKAGNISLSETRVVAFFLQCATGILIEDLAKAIYHWVLTDQGFTSQGTRVPLLWHKVVGYLWTVFYLSLITPQWACPYITGERLPIPGFAGLN
jgi:hypothetical protein